MSPYPFQVTDMPDMDTVWTYVWSDLLTMPVSIDEDNCVTIRVFAFTFAIVIIGIGLFLLRHLIAIFFRAVRRCIRSSVVLSMAVLHLLLIDDNALFWQLVDVVGDTAVSLAFQAWNYLNPFQDEISLEAVSDTALSDASQFGEEDRPTRLLDPEMTLDLSVVTTEIVPYAESSSEDVGSSTVMSGDEEEFHGQEVTIETSGPVVQPGQKNDEIPATFPRFEDWQIDVSRIEPDTPSDDSSRSDVTERTKTPVNERQDISLVDVIPSPAVADSEQEYVVEGILGAQYSLNRIKEVLIRWRDFDISEATWEPVESFASDELRHMVAKFDGNRRSHTVVGKIWRPHLVFTEEGHQLYMDTPDLHKDE